MEIKEWRELRIIKIHNRDNNKLRMNYKLKHDENDNWWESTEGISKRIQNDKS